MKIIKKSKSYNFEKTSSLISMGVAFFPVPRKKVKYRIVSLDLIS